jgi:hypothetical protein
MAIPVDKSSDDQSDLIDDLLRRKTQEPPSIETYSALIQILRENDLWDEAEYTRKELVEVLALPEHMWLEWIADTTRLQAIQLDENALVLYDLYARSIQDVPMSLKLWLDFLTFLETQCVRATQSSNDENDFFSLELLTSVYEDALETTGYNMEIVMICSRATLLY